MRVLVVNAGSSSLKLRALGPDDALEHRTDLDAPGGRFDRSELAAALEAAGPVDAVGHRVVHGGERLTAPTVVDDDVVRELDGLRALAPLHQGPALEAIAGVRALRGDVPHVACFDTAFHAGMPAAAATYPLPAAWRARWPLRRYGFHGLSHAWAARRVAERSGARRIVSCHLGAGASLAAVLDGRSVDTTMGFSPLEGLVMATRSGTVDPGLVLWLLGTAGLGVAEVEDGLTRGSGLAGLAGTPDMRQVLARAVDGDPDASLAVDVTVHVLARHVAGMAAALGGMDALLFTGGVGEHAAAIRAAAAERLAWLGVSLDPEANAAADGDAEITGAGAPVRSFVVTAREDIEIARGVRHALHP